MGTESKAIKYRCNYCTHETTITQYLHDRDCSLCKKGQYESVIDAKFEGIDDWGKAIFKVVDTNVRIGSVDRIFPDKNKAPNGTPKEIIEYFKKDNSDFVIFGTKFDCEPLGTSIKKDIKINII